MGRGGDSPHTVPCCGRGNHGQRTRGHPQLQGCRSGLPVQPSRSSVSLSRSHLCPATVPNTHLCSRTPERLALLHDRRRFRARSNPERMVDTFRESGTSEVSGLCQIDSLPPPSRQTRQVVQIAVLTCKNCRRAETSILTANILWGQWITTSPDVIAFKDRTTAQLPGVEYG